MNNIELAEKLYDFAKYFTIFGQLALPEKWLK